MSELRPIIFVLVLIGCWLLQSWRPKRAYNTKGERLTANFGLMLTGSLLVWLVVPLGAVGAAAWAQQNTWGLLPLTALPALVQTIAAIALLDCAIYWQHRAMHRWPLLWRLHRVHHSDLQLDTSSGVRFHPVEILLSMAYKMGIVIIIGASPATVLIYEVLLSSFALFNHSNWAMPGDAYLRKLLVTPDVHRVHHSTIPNETNSNYGNLLVLWDKLFGSYIAQPQQGHIEMQIGLEHCRDSQSQKLLALLANPFKN